MAIEMNETKVIHELEHNLKQENILKLKTLFPEVFCENQIDWEKLKLILGEDNLAHANERYHLNWAGKTDAYRALQTPPANTLIPCRSESVDFDTTQNVFIEAENMEALKILQKAYAGSVKMIYIDPPYNTGNDGFIYPDKFAETREEYAKRVGDQDQNGYVLRDGAFAGAWRKNGKDNGHYHSNWLNMMLPRLHLAKTLLRDDGVIFISIDDNEQAQLKLLCDEVFGAENFVSNVIRRSKIGGGSDNKHFAQEADYLLVYAKNYELLNVFYAAHSSEDLKRYKERDEVGYFFWDTYSRSGLATGTDESLYYEVLFPDGTKKSDRWRRSKERLKQDLEQGEAKFTKTKNGWNIHFKQRLPMLGKRPRQILFDGFGNTSGTEEIRNTLGSKYVFDYPKPLSLIKFVIHAVSDKNALILDFFSGSGTTAHAVMQLNAEDGGNRRYICVQLPEETAEQSEAYKAGYLNIAEIAKERIRRAGTHISGSLKDGQAVDTGFKVFKLAESHFKQWRRPLAGSLNAAEQLSLLQDFQDVVNENASIENMAYELALRLGFKLTDSIEFSGSVVWLNNAEQTRKIALLLDTVNQAVLDEVRAQSPEKVFALDKVFAGNDALKANTALQFKDAGIDFEAL